MNEENMKQQNDKIIILIGGGQINKDYNENELIDQYIVKKTKKQNPNYLYIGFGNKYAESTYDLYKKNYQKLGCNTKHLKKKNCINNPTLTKEKIKEADIIYIGGGDTIELLDFIKQNQLEDDLKKAYTRGCIMVGNSAGAILLSKEGFSDAKIIREESNEYEFIKGLEFTNYIVTPHYEKSSEKTKQLKEKMENKRIIGIMNGCAIVIKNNEIIDIIKTNNKTTAYYLTKKEKYKESEIKKEG